MSPYSRAQRVSVWVASRLAMNEVPTRGIPRGPGGRRGATVVGVADMSRELLWETGAMILQAAPEGRKVPAWRELIAKTFLAEFMYNRASRYVERASYNGSIEASQASDVGSIPIARSINHDDSIDLTRLSYLNSIKKRRILDGSWTVLDSIGRSLLGQIVEEPEPTA